MSVRKLSAGDIIDARCTKCRAILNHRIVAMVEDKVVRVECNTCNGIHNYYAPEEKKSTAGGSVVRKSAAAPRKTEKTKASSDRAEWEALYQSVDRSRAVAYDINGKYQVNSYIEHTVFGFGVVKAVIKPNKMEVLFQDGKKLLRCSA